jgi:hypothetical protein
VNKYHLNTFEVGETREFQTSDEVAWRRLLQAAAQCRIRTGRQFKSHRINSLRTTMTRLA